MPPALLDAANVNLARRNARAPRPVDLYLLDAGGALVPTSWDTSTDEGLDALLDHVRSCVDQDEDGGALVVFGVMARPGSVAHVLRGGAIVGLLVAR